MSEFTKLNDEQAERLEAAEAAGILDPLVRLIAERVIARGEQLKFIHFNEFGGIDLTRYEDILTWLDDPTRDPSDI